MKWKPDDPETRGMAERRLHDVDHDGLDFGTGLQDGMQTMFATHSSPGEAWKRWSR